MCGIKVLIIFFYWNYLELETIFCAAIKYNAKSCYLFKYLRGEMRLNCGIIYFDLVFLFKLELSHIFMKLTFIINLPAFPVKFTLIFRVTHASNASHLLVFDANFPFVLNSLIAFIMLRAVWSHITYHKVWGLIAFI